MDDQFLVCLRADDVETVAGAVFTYRCYKCKRHVMIAPSGIKRLQSDLSIRVLCVNCLPADYDSIKSELAGPVEEILEEMMTAHYNHHRNRN